MSDNVRKLQAPPVASCARCADIGERVSREIRTALILQATPRDLVRVAPHDLAAEETVLAAMFDGYAPPSWLRDDDFFLVLHQAAFLVLSVALENGQRVSPAAVARLMEAQGYAGRRIAEELTIIAGGPTCVLLEEPARRVWELARRRDALGAVARLEGVLRDVDMTTEDAAREAGELAAVLALLTGDDTWTRTH